MLKTEINEYCHKQGSCIIPNTYCIDCKYYEECSKKKKNYNELKAL